MNAWLFALAGTLTRAAREFGGRLRHGRARGRRVDTDHERLLRDARDVHDVERRERSWQRLGADDAWVGGWR